MAFTLFFLVGEILWRPLVVSVRTPLGPVAALAEPATKGFGAIVAKCKHVAR